MQIGISMLWRASPSFKCTRADGASRARATWVFANQVLGGRGPRPRGVEGATSAGPRAVQAGAAPIRRSPTARRRQRAHPLAARHGRRALLVPARRMAKAGLFFDNFAIDKLESPALIGERQEVRLKGWAGELQRGASHGKLLARRARAAVAVSCPPVSGCVGSSERFCG